MKTNYCLASVSTAVLITCVSPACAQGWDDWEFVLGVGAVYGPDVEGGTKSETELAYDIEVRWRDTVSLSFEGVSWDFYQSENFLMSTSLSYDGGREASEHVNYTGLGDIGGGAVLGFGMSTDLGPLSASVDVSKYFGGSEGLTAEFGIGTDIPLAALFGGRELSFGAEEEPSLKEIGPILSLGLSATWANDDYNGAYYGVTAAQSAASGLSAFNAGSGFNSASLNLGIMFPLTERTTLTTFVEHTKYIGDAGKSPIIRDDDQTSFGAMMNYRF